MLTPPRVRHQGGPRPASTLGPGASGTRRSQTRGVDARMIPTTVARSAPWLTPTWLRAVPLHATHAGGEGMHGNRITGSATPSTQDSGEHGRPHNHTPRSARRFCATRDQRQGLESPRLEIPTRMVGLVRSMDGLTTGETARMVASSFVKRGCFDDSRSSPARSFDPAPANPRQPGCVDPRSDEPPREAQAPDVLVPPRTDHGTLPNLRWSFADSHNHLCEGG